MIKQASGYGNQQPIIMVSEHEFKSLLASKTFNAHNKNVFIKRSENLLSKYVS
jgi:hypothetical protein